MVIRELGEGSAVGGMVRAGFQPNAVKISWDCGAIGDGVLQGVVPTGARQSHDGELVEPPCRTSTPSAGKSTSTLADLSRLREYGFVHGWAGEIGGAGRRAPDVEVDVRQGRKTKSSFVPHPPGERVPLLAEAITGNATPEKWAPAFRWGTKGGHWGVLAHNIFGDGGVTRRSDVYIIHYFSVCG
ncbi:MAG: hypothetical protein ACYDBB_22795 [Armatimonadota bacterium]